MLVSALILALGCFGAILWSREGDNLADLRCNNFWPKHQLALLWEYCLIAEFPAERTHWVDAQSYNSHSNMRCPVISKPCNLFWLNFYSIHDSQPNDATVLKTKIKHSQSINQSIDIFNSRLEAHAQEKTHYNTVNKKAVLSQRWPRMGAPKIFGTPWMFCLSLILSQLCSRLKLSSNRDVPCKQITVMSRNRIVLQWIKHVGWSRLD